jgi:hypothetical protein
MNKILILFLITQCVINHFIRNNYAALIQVTDLNTNTIVTRPFWYNIDYNGQRMRINYTSPLIISRRVFLCKENTIIYDNGFDACYPTCLNGTNCQGTEKCGCEVKNLEKIFESSNRTGTCKENFHQGYEYKGVDGVEKITFCTTTTGVLLYYSVENPRTNSNLKYQLFTYYETFNHPRLFYVGDRCASCGNKN